MRRGWIRWLSAYDGCGCASPGQAKKAPAQTQLIPRGPLLVCIGAKVRETTDG